MFFLNFAKKDKDDSVKPHHFLKLLNLVILKGRSYSKIICCGGWWSLLAVYSTSYIKYIIPFITKLLCGGAIIIGGVSISTLLISYFIYQKEDDNNEEANVETEQEILFNFVNKDYKTFIDLYREKKEDKFTNKSKKIINGLKEYENHETYDLPYSYNPNIIFYYDSDSESFYYYCQSDVSSKILNSVCRTYTITKKCIQLFQDDEEIKYMRQEAENEHVDEQDISSVDVSMSGSVISDDSFTLTDEKEEGSNGFVNIFYNKRQKSKTVKENKSEPLKTNKFIYKGTLDEYKKKKNMINAKNEIKPTSYQEYVAKYLKK